MKSPDLQNVDSLDSDEDSDDDYIGHLNEDDDGPMRPEDEAAMLAYERAQKIFEEEQEEAVARATREKERSASRGRPTGSRNASRQRGSAGGANEEGGGAAVLGLLAQLDRGMK